MAYKFVLIKKYDVNHSYIKNSKKQRNIIENFLKQYSGFEGSDIFYYEEERILPKLNDFIHECREAIKNENKSDYLLLYLGTSIKVPVIVNKEAKKIGYDYGIKVEENSIYSSIFHEILFGRLEELIAFKNQLNEHLLFPTREVAEEYARVHHKLDEEGKGVEWEEDMEIFEIWKFEL